MPIESITSDPESLTLVAIGHFPVPVERLWQAWEDPRQIERFWGPPEWPATFTRHDMREGGRSAYHMTGPKGEIAAGHWRFLQVDAPHRFVVEDGFTDNEGDEMQGMPTTRMEVVFEPTDGGSRFVATSTFPSLEAMEQLVAMGMVEGLTAALAQLDEVLADLREHSRTFQASLERVGETQVRVTRVVRGDIHQIWRAHHEPELVRQWMLGPDGWVMVDCQIGTAVGERTHLSWETAEGTDRFGLGGEVQEIEAPWRVLATESMDGLDVPPTTNETVFSPLPGAHTRITVTITYPSAQVREQVIGTGMLAGMEASYARLDTLAQGMAQAAVAG